jgi:hypothetical protein
MNDPEVIASEILRHGAIITLQNNGAQRSLVGFLLWVGPNRLFWFAANGDDPKEDGHLLTFDAARVDKPSEITFLTKERVVARLTSIDDSGLPDAGDFRAAWHVWQQRRPRCERLIGASLTYCLTSSGER